MISFLVDLPPDPPQWAEGYKKYFQIWNFWTLIDPWYLIRRAKIINSVSETQIKRNSILNTPGSAMKFLNSISKNDIFWPLCFSATFRGRELWLKMTSHMVPKCGLLSLQLARLSSKVRGGGYSLLTKIYGFFGISNHATRNGQKCLKLSKSTLGQVKLSVEVQ
jgi:hypothetical protein